MKGICLGDLRISSLFFADDVVLFVSSGRGLYLTLEQFSAECEVAGVRIRNSKSEAMVFSQKRVEWSAHSGSETLLFQVEEFK